MNKQEAALAETLRAAIEKLEGGGWSDDDHLALLASAQKSSFYEMSGGITAPNVMTRERWNQLSARDRANFFKNGGKLIDAPKGGER